MKKLKKEDQRMLTNINDMKAAIGAQLTMAGALERLFWNKIREEYRLEKEMNYTVNSEDMIIRKLYKDQL